MWRLKKKSKNLFAALVYVIILCVGFVWVYAVSTTAESKIIVAGFFMIALIHSCAIKLTDPWEKDCHQCFTQMRKPNIN